MRKLFRISWESRWSDDYELSAPSTSGNRNWYVHNVLTHRWKYRTAPRISRNTSTKQFPIFSLRKRIYPRRPCLFGPRWDGNVPCAPRVVTTPNNFPWSYFHNKKHQIGFPLTRASICRLRAPPSPPVSLSVHSFPFIPSRVIRFLSAEPCRSVTFQSVPAVLEPYRLYYVFASSFVRHFYRWRRASASSFVLRGMKSAKGRSESRWKGQWSTSADHVIILSCCKATQNETFELLLVNCIVCDIKRETSQIR